MADFTLVVTTSKLNYRTKPNTAHGQVKGSYSKGAEVVCVEKLHVGDQRWYKIKSNGYYMCGYMPGDGWYVKDKVPQKPGKPTENKPIIDKGNSNSMGNGLDEKIMRLLYGNAVKNEGLVDGSTRLFGAPFQFIPQTDYRHSSTINLGRMYLENIVPESPIIHLIPGKPDYLPDLSQEQRKAVHTLLSGKTDEGVLQDIIKSDTRYFGFTPDYSNYIRYVNLLCRVSAIYLGIGDVIAPNSDKPYRLFNWSNYKYKNDKVIDPNDQESKGLFSTLSTAVGDFISNSFKPYEYLSIYADAGETFSESSNNSTTQSALDQVSSGLEGKAKDLSFAMNAVSAEELDKALKSLSSSVDSITDSGFVKKNSFMDRFLGMTNNVIQGHNMIFPSIWTDNNYDSDHQLTMELDSPYGDKESIYLNCIVPMMHVIPLAMPRQTSANTFTSPFIVRVLSQGRFNCEMGIVNSINIEKGGKGDWSIDGLPTKIKITISISDLYSNLMVTPTNQPGNFFNNEGLMDFLAVTCGLDVTSPQIDLKINTMVETLVNKYRPTDIGNHLYSKAVEQLREILAPLMRFN